MERANFACSRDVDALSMPPFYQTAGGSHSEKLLTLIVITHT